MAPDEEETLAETLGLPDRLPPVRLAPEHELVAAARASGLLRRLKDLVEWVGERREVTEEGDLTAADAVAAARAVGVETPDAVEEMSDLPELVHLWEVAVAVDLVTVEDGVAEGNAGFLPADDDFDDLATWTFTFAETLASLELDADLAGEETLEFEGSGAVALVMYLARTDGVPMAELEEMVREGAVEGLPEDEAAPAWDAWVAANGEPAAVLVERLLAHGAVRLDGEITHLTPLGVWAMREQLTAHGIEIPELPATENLSAAGLTAASFGMAEDELAIETEAWLALRTPSAAAEELLDAAAGAEPSGRVFATSTAVLLGGAAEPRWRKALAEPELSPYAKLALEQLTGEAAELTAEELSWLLLDQLTASVDVYGQYDPDAVGDVVAGTVPAGREQEVLDVAWRQPHPNRRGALDLVGAHHPDKKVAKAARTAAFKAG